MRDQEATKQLEQFLGVECRCDLNATCSIHNERALYELLTRKAEHERQMKLALKCPVCGS